MSQSQQMRITDDEMKTIQVVFKDNIQLLKLMRKIFLPEYDPKAPLGQVVDLWTVKDVAGMTPEECKIYFWTRRDLIMHIESQLLQLEALSNAKVESEKEKENRIKKDSQK